MEFAQEIQELDNRDMRISIGQVELRKYKKNQEKLRAECSSRIPKNLVLYY